MSGLSKVDRDTELASSDNQSVDVVGMFVGDDNGVKGLRLFTGQLHAAEELATAEAAIDQDAGAATGDNCTVAFGARGQHREAHHVLSIPRMVVHSPFSSQQWVHCLLTRNGQCGTMLQNASAKGLQTTMWRKAMGIAGDWKGAR